MRLSGEPFVAKLDGHLTRAQLDETLGTLGEQIASVGLATVILDCSEMGGYDLDARHAFVDWNKRWRDQVVRVAIVTDNRLYHVVVATMSLAAGQAMKAFSSHSEAETWARTGL